MRQIEVMVWDYAQYNWFDPMTAYPYGKIIDWGPLYPFIAATLCRVLGASSRNDIVYLAGWVSPLMATIMVPVTYKAGKMFWDWKAGIASAGLISITSFVYFSQSSYGWIGHHITETLFTTLFFLAYMYALISIRKNPVDVKNPETLCIPILLSGLAGVIYFFGFISSPTVLLALLIVSIYSFFQYIIDYLQEERSDYLLFLNFISFFLIAVLITIFGFHQDGLSLTTYSRGHVYVILALIAETVLLYFFSRVFRRNRLHYFIALAGIIAGLFILIQIHPVFQEIKNQAYSLFFGFSPYSVSVTDTASWTFSAAYENFNVALLLMAGGLVVLVFHLIKKRENNHFFLLVWFAVMLLVTVQHQRFQYYLTVPIILLTSICITESVHWSQDTVLKYFTLLFPRFSRGSPLQENEGNGSTEKLSSGKKERKKIKTSEGSGTRRSFPELPKVVTLVCIVILTIILVLISAGQDYSYGISTPAREIPKDWTETLEWLKTSTPSPMVDYFQRYDSPGFSYPDKSFGIMAPWDEGHRITFFTQRIPITNPFQDNLPGKEGAAAFFLCGDESSADKILTTFKGRYVITDLSTATDTFPSLIPWVNNSEDISPYIKWFFIPDPLNPSRVTRTHLLDDAYFQTMVVRLQMFDGSLVIPDTAQYIQYMIMKVPDSDETASVNGDARVIMSERSVNISQSLNFPTILPEGDSVESGTRYAGIFSSLPFQPIKKVPALTHYRLVHESPNNISVLLYPGSEKNVLPDIKSVKVFEYVRGAQISGQGIIELPLITNTGRTFVYRQESADDEFIVPYSTEGNTYDVRATGLYHIVGTSRYITVTEEDVMGGRGLPVQAENRVM